MGYNETSEGWEDIVYVARGLTNTTDWKEYKQSFYIPENMTDLRITLNAGWVKNINQGNATVWFDDLKIIKDIEEKNIDIDLIVLYNDEANKTLEQLFKPSKNSAVLEYTKIDDTKYEIEVSSNEPFTLVFACAYDEFWVAHTDSSKEIESIPIYEMLNGFYINKTGNFTVVIEYKPQQWFNIGAGITIVSIIVFLGYVLWIKKRYIGKKLINLINTFSSIRVRKK